MKKLFFLALAPVLILGCKVEPPKPPLVQTVAVLPFDSEVADLNAPDIMQRYVYLALKLTPYQVINYREVNEKLEKTGITDGGQLPVIDPTKLGKDLGVQALIYGNVTSFDYLNVGFYRHRKAGLELKMVDVTTGQTLWENSGTSLTPAVALDTKEAQREFVKGVADQAADKLFNSPLDAEAQQSVIKTLKTLPGFLFCGFAADDQTPHAVKSAGKDILKGLIRKK